MKAQANGSSVERELRSELARTRTLLWDVMRAVDELSHPELVRRFRSLMPRKPCLRARRVR